MLQLPNDSQRIVVLGHTGYGKTHAALWQLSHRSFDKLPWIIVDTKGDKMIARIDPVEIGLHTIPTKPGLYVVRPRPDEVDELSVMLWKVYERGKTGLFFDEGYYISENNELRDPFRAILTRGRSKKIPVITCSQRPVWLDRFVFSETDYVQLFWLIDRRDRMTVQSFIPVNVNKRLEQYHSVWYDIGKDSVFQLSPAPVERDIISRFKDRLGTKRAVL